MARDERQGVARQDEDHLKGTEFWSPPMMLAISSVSLKSGSNPILPPGEEVNMNPDDKHTQRHKHEKQTSISHKGLT